MITGNWGSDLILLVKGIASAGLKVQMGSTFLELPGTLSSAGDAALGYFVADYYIPEAGGDKARDLYDRYKAKAGAAPSTSEVKSVMLMQMLQAALADLPPGKVDATKLALSLEKAKIQTELQALTRRLAGINESLARKVRGDCMHTHAHARRVQLQPCSCKPFRSSCSLLQQQTRA